MFQFTLKRHELKLFIIFLFFNILNLFLYYLDLCSSLYFNIIYYYYYYNYYYCCCCCFDFKKPGKQGTLLKYCFHY